MREENPEFVDFYRHGVISLYYEDSDYVISNSQPAHAAVLIEQFLLSLRSLYISMSKN